MMKKLKIDEIEKCLIELKSKSKSNSDSQPLKSILNPTSIPMYKINFLNLPNFHLFNYDDTNHQKFIEDNIEKINGEKIERMTDVKTLESELGLKQGSENWPFKKPIKRGCVQTDDFISALNQINKVDEVRLGTFFTKFITSDTSVLERNYQQCTELAAILIQLAKKFKKKIHPQIKAIYNEKGQLAYFTVEIPDKYKSNFVELQQKIESKDIEKAQKDAFKFSLLAKKLRPLVTPYQSDLDTSDIVKAFTDKPPPNCKEIWVEMEKGNTLHAYEFYPEKANPGDIQDCILYCHGNKTYAKHLLAEMQTLANETGKKVIIYDYPGYGLSSGLIYNAVDDLQGSVKTMINHIAKDKKIKNISVQTESLGGLAATEVVDQMHYKLLSEKKIWLEQINIRSGVSVARQTASYADQYLFPHSKEHYQERQEKSFDKLKRLKEQHPNSTIDTYLDHLIELDKIFQHINKILKPLKNADDTYPDKKFQAIKSAAKNYLSKINSEIKTDTIFVELQQKIENLTLPLSSVLTQKFYKKINNAENLLKGMAHYKKMELNEINNSIDVEQFLHKHQPIDSNHLPFLNRIYALAALHPVFLDHVRSIKNLDRLFKIFNVFLEKNTPKFKTFLEKSLLPLLYLPDNEKEMSLYKDVTGKYYSADRFNHFTKHNNLKGMHEEIQDKKIAEKTIKKFFEDLKGEEKNSVFEKALNELNDPANKIFDDYAFLGFAKSIEKLESVLEHDKQNLSILFSTILKDSQEKYLSSENLVSLTTTPRIFSLNKINKINHKKITHFQTYFINNINSLLTKQSTVNKIIDRMETLFKNDEKYIDLLPIRPPEEVNLNQLSNCLLLLEYLSQRTDQDMTEVMELYEAQHYPDLTSFNIYFSRSHTLQKEGVKEKEEMELNQEQIWIEEKEENNNLKTLLEYFGTEDSDFKPVIKGLEKNEHLKSLSSHLSSLVENLNKFKEQDQGMIYNRLKIGLKTLFTKSQNQKNTYFDAEYMKLAQQLVRLVTLQSKLNQKNNPNLYEQISNLQNWMLNLSANETLKSKLSNIKNFIDQLEIFVKYPKAKEMDKFCDKLDSPSKYPNINDVDILNKMTLFVLNVRGDIDSKVFDAFMEYYKPLNLEALQIYLNNKEKFKKLNLNFNPQNLNLNSKVEEKKEKEEFNIEEIKQETLETNVIANPQTIQHEEQEEDKIKREKLPPLQKISYFEYQHQRSLAQKAFMFSAQNPYASFFPSFLRVAVNSLVETVASFVTSLFKWNMNPGQAIVKMNDVYQNNDFIDHASVKADKVFAPTANLGINFEKKTNAQIQKKMKKQNLVNSNKAKANMINVIQLHGRNIDGLLSSTEYLFDKNMHGGYNNADLDERRMIIELGENERYILTLRQKILLFHLSTECRKLKNTNFMVKKLNFFNKEDPKEEVKNRKKRIADMAAKLLDELIPPQENTNTKKNIK